MKRIAVPFNDGFIDGHFGHCEYFGVYTISDDNKVIDFEKLDSPNGCGCKSNISEVLASMGVTTMLAGGIGGGAINVLGSYGIDVVRGCEGKADDIVNAFISGDLVDSGVSCRTHEQHHGEGHEHGHVCNH